MSEHTQTVENSELALLDLKPPCRLLIWRLAAAGGGEWIGDIRPAPAAAVRKELLESGLGQSESRKNLVTGRAGTWVELTEAGWAWTAQNLGEDPGGGSAASDTLSVMLKSLRHFLDGQRLTAEDVFRRTTEEANTVPFPDYIEEEPVVMSPMVEAAIARAYLRITSGRHGVRVLLAHLRQCVELVREELDVFLRQLAVEGRLTLESLKEGELSDADRAAALIGSRGERYHVVCMEEWIE